MQRTFAQISTPDTLLATLRTAHEDSTKARLYNEIVINYYEDYTDSALWYSYLGEEAALRCKDTFQRGLALKGRGVSFDIAGQFDSCLYYLGKADSIFNSIDRFDKKAAVIGDMAAAYYVRGNYELALRNYLRSLDLMKKYNSRNDIAKMLNNVGLVYRARKDFHNAVKYYKESLAIKKEINDEKGIMNTTINIGSAFQRQDMFDSAYYYANEARKLATKLNIERDIISSTANMGAALASMERFDEALPLLLTTEKEAQKKNLKSVLLTVYESLGFMAMKTDVNRAIVYYSRALSIAKQTNNLETTATYYQLIAKGLARQGKYKTAYRYLDTAKVLHDSLTNIENSRQVNEMTAIYESAEKEKTIQRLNSDNEVKRQDIIASHKVRNYLILSTLLFIVLTGVAFKAYKNNHDKKIKLNEQNKIIEQSLRDKEILLKEIHHRVKNNLQIVSSLLSLQSNYIDDEKALDAIRESKNRVQSIAIIHQNLYQDESLVNIDVHDYVTQLIQYILDTYGLTNKDVALKMDIDHFRLDVDTLLPIGLIINELVSNCMKYAFPNQQKGEINVMIKLMDTKVKLSVYDNGIGMLENELHFNKNSFGHKMIHAFVKKLKGIIDLRNEEGTRIDIYFDHYNL